MKGQLTGLESVGVTVKISSNVEEMSVVADKRLSFAGNSGNLPRYLIRINNYP